MINPTKTERLKIVGSKDRTLRKIGDWKLGLRLSDVKSVDSIKYLGVLIDKKLQFNEHTQKVENALKAQLCALYKLTSNYGSINPVTLVQLYKLQVDRCGSTEPSST